jgi:hypothetical protein
MNKIEEIYLQPERYNPRVRATISGAWIVVYEDGNSFPVCGEYEANNEQEVRAILKNRGEEC